MKAISKLKKWFFNLKWVNNGIREHSSLFKNSEEERERYRGELLTYFDDETNRLWKLQTEMMYKLEIDNIKMMWSGARSSNTTEGFLSFLRKEENL